MANLNAHTALAILVITVSAAVIVDSLHTADTNRCRDNWSLVCEDEVLTRLFLDRYKSTTVGAECCKQLVRKGRVCLERLVMRDLHDPFFKKHTKLAQKIFARTEQLWANCTLVAAAAA
ncbi:hypothetical protein V6N13_117638 [Hibiscus sabdariffa]|uniref:Prolamin-like domain-containing protein n=1 Tax=Hibiscus sabdariffa TaxID=183260 RepID=A0ABR2PB77_9ROSI